MKGKRWFPIVLIVLFLATAILLLESFAQGKNEKQEDIVNLPDELYIQDTHASAMYLRYDFNLKEDSFFKIDILNEAGVITFGIKEKDTESYVVEKTIFEADGNLQVFIPAGSYSVMITKNKFTGVLSMKTVTRNMESVTVGNTPEQSVNDLPEELILVENHAYALSQRYDFVLKEDSYYNIAVTIETGSIAFGVKNKNSDTYIVEQDKFEDGDTLKIFLEAGNYSVVLRESDFTGVFKMSKEQPFPFNLSADGKLPPV